MLCVYFLPQVLLHINICSIFYIFYIFYIFTSYHSKWDLPLGQSSSTSTHVRARADPPRATPQTAAPFFYYYVVFMLFSIMEPANSSGLPTKREREREREKEIERESARARESDSVCVCEWEREGERESGAMIDNRGVRGRISSRVTCGENSWKSVPRYILCSKSLYGVLLRMYALRSSSVRVTWDTRQDFSEVSVPDNLTM